MYASSVRILRYRKLRIILFTSQINQSRDVKFWNLLVVLYRTPRKNSGHGRDTIWTAWLLGQQVPIPSMEVLQNIPAGGAGVTEHFSRRSRWQNTPAGGAGVTEHSCRRSRCDRTHTKRLQVCYQMYQNVSSIRLQLNQHKVQACEACLSFQLMLIKLRADSVMHQMMK